MVLNGAIDPKSTKDDTDETLEENQAAEEAALQVQITNAQAAAEALGDDPAIAKQAADPTSEVTRLEKKAAGGKGAGQSSLAHRVEQKSRFVERETKRLEPLRKDWETVHDELAAREAALAEDKLQLQKLKDDLVAGNSCVGASM